MPSRNHFPTPFPTSTVGLTPEEVDSLSQYGYVPTEWICILFLVLFSISTAIHFLQASYFRIWWLMVTVVFGGIGEIIGWSGRLWSSKNILGSTSFLMQFSVTIIAPTFLSAANFIILGRIVELLGPQYSRLSPKTYNIVFLTADVIALVVQAVGGSIASSADDTAPGGHIMLAGIAIQMAAITIYSAIAIEFLVRYHRDWPLRAPESPEIVDFVGNKQEGVSPEKPPRIILTLRIQLMILGLAISTLFLYMRAIYRTIELSDGWTGRIFTTEVYFNVLEGMPIAVALYAINALHPGILLPPKKARTGPTLRLTNAWATMPHEVQDNSDILRSFSQQFICSPYDCLLDAVMFLLVLLDAGSVICILSHPLVS